MPSLFLGGIKMIEIKLTIDGKKQSFKKREFTIRDNIFAVKHQIEAANFYADENKSNDSEEYEKIQMNFAKTVTQIFNNEFTVEQLLDGLSIKDSQILDELYIQALGGNIDEESEKK